MIDRIKELREKIFKTQNAFATFLDVSNQAISKYEKGIATITTSSIVQLIETYNINPLWLLVGKGNMFLNKEDTINLQSDNNILKKENERLSIENQLLKELIKK